MVGYKPFQNGLFSGKASQTGPSGGVSAKTLDIRPLSGFFGLFSPSQTSLFNSQMFLRTVERGDTALLREGSGIARAV